MGGGVTKVIVTQNQFYIYIFSILYSQFAFALVTEPTKQNNKQPDH